MEVREAIGGQNRAVSHTRSLCVTEQSLTAVQIEDRQAISTIDRHSASPLYPAHFGENCHPHHPRSSSDGVSWLRRSLISQTASRRSL